jgi:uncharacterized protein (DUF305 family)
MRQRWTRWRWPVLLALILMTALVLAPGALAASTPRMQQLHPMGAQPLDQLSGDAVDQAFLAQMTMHHAMGVMMTQPVVASGAHQELKGLGAQMIADQSREIEQMRGWLQSWYGLDVSCPMTPGMMPGATTGMMPGMMTGQPGERPGAGPLRPGSMMTGTGMPTVPGTMPETMPGGPSGTMPMTGMPVMGMPVMGAFPNLPPEQLDATFMTWMIAHHQGAIDMAALAEERAAHQEVKGLATSIISTQSAAIEVMRGWLVEWYGR